MNVEDARTTIVKKFTNHRNHCVNVDKISSVKMYQALREAAAALVDYKAFSKGKSLFKRRNLDTIIERRNSIYSDSLNTDSPLPLISAYQKALKELWNEADQDHWERSAADEPEDIRS